MIEKVVQKPNVAASYSSPGNEGNGKAAENVSTSGIKTVSTWKRVGHLEKYHQGIKILIFDPFGRDHVLYISQADTHNIVDNRIPGDLIWIDETGDSRGVISTEGRVYRSRSGRALCLNLPYFAGGDIMCPWKAFLSVLEGKHQKAIISMLEQANPSPRAVSKPQSASITAGLEGGF